MAGYRDLKVWQAGMRLTVEVYRITGSFPAEEKFGLVSQMRRAAVSVPSNLAEGHARNTPNEMIRFASLSLGSLAEVETQLLISRELGFANNEEVDCLLEQSEHIGRMLHGLIRSNRSADKN